MSPKVEQVLKSFRQLSIKERDYVLAEIIKSSSERGAQDKPIPLGELNLRYPGEWIAVRLPKGENRYNPQTGVLVVHHAEKEQVWKQVNQLPEETDVYVYYNGPVMPKGFGVTFYDTEDTPVVAEVVS
jgi:hypothetical protein